MHKIKHIIKSTIASFLYYSGILDLIARTRLSNRTVVLMYHRILDDEQHQKSFSNDGIIVSPDIFEKQMHFLSRKFKILNITEFSNLMQSDSETPSKSCLVTFDDGWQDNYTNALKILNKYNISPVIFLPVDFIGKTDLFWQEKLSHLLLYFFNSQGHYKKTLSDYPEIIALLDTDINNINSNIRQFIARVKTRHFKSIYTLISDLYKLVPENDVSNITKTVDTYINWKQVREMNQKGIYFGSHAASHYVLTDLDKEQLNNELRISKSLIEKETGLEINSIAYPNGNFNESVIASAQEAGYIAGFTTQPGFVSSKTHPLSIPRMNIHEGSTKTIPLFYCRILGIF